MLPSMPRTALRSVARHVSSPSIHARPRPALPPIPIALSPVFSRPNVEPLHVVQCKRLFSSSSIVSSVAANKVLGVAAALKAQEDDAFQVKPEIFDEFSLKGRVGVVSGGNGGLGLEMAVALCEAGAKIHALDLPAQPSSDFHACIAYVDKLKNGSSLAYHPTDVTDQSRISSLVIDQIAREEGRLDLCVAAAGILGPAEGESCLTYSKKDWERVMKVNLDGVFYTCQAAARGMVETGCKAGSIVMIASMSGSITNKDQPWVAYNTSKSGVLQMARSMACELGKENIRVNTISPGHIYTKMTAALLDVHPETGDLWSNSNPLGRLGQVHELRGVITWLASDASSFCTGSDILVSGGHHSW